MYAPHLSASSAAYAKVPRLPDPRMYTSEIAGKDRDPGCDVGNFFSLAWGVVGPNNLTGPAKFSSSLGPRVSC